MKLSKTVKLSGQIVNAVEWVLLCHFMFYVQILQSIVILNCFVDCNALVYRQDKINVARTDAFKNIDLTLV